MRINKDNKKIYGRNDLANYLFERSYYIYTKEQANDLTKYFIEYFQSALLEGDIEIKGLGVFKRNIVKRRIYKIPREKISRIKEKGQEGIKIVKETVLEKIQIIDKYRVSFKISETIKKLLNSKEEK